MNVQIKRISKEIPLPEYKTAGAAACDLAAREEVTIEPGKVGLVPLNVAIKLPPGHWGLMAPRSSLPKRGVMMANNVGIFDEDFCGDSDEYKTYLFNFSDTPVTITKGERILQLMILPRELITFTEVESLGTTARGGFGTTGTH